jgi:nitrilase
LVVDPTGAIVVGPVNREQRIVYAECDPARASVARRSLDVTGHYNRPDIFRLEIDRSARPPVTFAGR